MEDCCSASTPFRWKNNVAAEKSSFQRLTVLNSARSRCHLLLPVLPLLLQLFPLNQRVYSRGYSSFRLRTSVQSWG